MAVPAKSLNPPRTIEQRADGWRNALTGLGDIQRDKRLSMVLELDELLPDEIDELVEGSDMAARIVETPAEEMLAGGFRVVVDDDPELGEEVTAFCEDLNVCDRLVEAIQDADAYGGSGILLGAVDRGRNLADPLNLERLEEIGWLTVLTARELFPVAWYDDVMAARYGEPSIYEIQPISYEGKIIRGPLAVRDLPLVHESRLLRFRGTRLSRKRTREQRGWGGSVLVRCIHVLRDFEQSWAGAAHLLTDFSQAVMKIKGLVEMLESGHEDLIIKRAALIDMSRSLARCVLLDAEDEEFERKATPMSGMPEMLQQLALRLSAAARMPVSKLMGQAPAGLNATGASDIRFWYDYLASRRTKQALPAITAFLKLVFACKSGPTNGTEPDNWKVEFPPLWQLTELEEADLKLKTAQADAQWVTMGAITGPEVAISHFSGVKFNPGIVIDVEARQGLVDGTVPGAAVDPNNPNAETPGAGGGPRSTNGAASGGRATSGTAGPTPAGAAAQ